MKRRLFNLLAAASLLLCVATVALWIRSFWAADALTWEGVNDDFGVATQKGSVMIGSEPGGGDGGFKCQFGRPPEQLTFEDEFRDAGIEWMGFGYAHISLESIRTIMFPLWFACILFALWPGFWLTLRLKRRHRSDTILCAICGYDLRATPDRCPECGTLSGN